MTSEANERPVDPALHLLNQACLDLVAQMRKLKRENTCLRLKLKEKAGTPSEFGRKTSLQKKSKAARNVTA